MEEPKVVYKPKIHVKLDKPQLDTTPVDVIQVVFNLEPRVGDDSCKIAVTMQLRMLFKQTFPKEPPVVEIITSKGIGDEELVDLN